MRIKILFILLLLTSSCDSYRSGASKMVGMRGYCIWNKDKNGYRASFSDSLPPSENLVYEKCDDVKKCISECKLIASKRFSLTP